jgi:hypothetical protein
METIIIVCICLVGIIIAFIMIDVVKCIRKKCCKKPNASIEASKEVV